MTTKRYDEMTTGIAVEDDIIRLAVVGRVKDVIHVIHVAQIPIPKMQPVVAEQPPLETGEEGEQNVFTSASTQDIDEVRNQAVREFVEGHVAGRTALCVGFGEPFIRLILLANPPKANRTAILKKIAAEADLTAPLKQIRDSMDYLPITKDRLLAAVNVEASPLLDIFALPQGIRRQPTRLEFMMSNELALINLVRVHFRFMPQEVVHIIHVERDKTRLFIMEGGELRAIVPTIQQGFENTSNVTVLHDRIELAAEGAGYPKADSIVLSGMAEDIGLRQEILPNNPDIIFHSLNRLRIACDEEIPEAQRLADYAMPISLAWQKLQPEHPRFHRLNVLPHNIRERQRKFKLAWHGFLLLLVLFGITLFMTVRILEHGNKLKVIRQKLQVEQKQIAEQKVIVDQIYAVENTSTSIINSTNLLDTLLYNAELWSQVLDTLASGAGSPQRLWVSELKPDKESGTQVIGYAMDRPSIPSFSAHIGQGVLREVSVQIIGQRKVFRYDVKRELERIHPYRGSPTAAWHDSVTVLLGDVAKRFPAPKPEAQEKGKKAKGKAKGKKS